MTPVRRWLVVALLAVVAVAAPPLVRAWPVSDSSVSAADLLTRIESSQSEGGHPYAGYVETSGTVKLPVGDEFSDLGSLFGEQSRLRVWWASDHAWRVDRLETTGEVDLVHDGRLTTTYDYADARASISRDPEIRLPRSSDLVPPALAKVVLDGATAGEVSRLPTRRVAGVDAPGLRLDPASTQTSIDHVDVWADPDSGLPLRVDVYAVGSGIAAFSTAFDDFSDSTPDTSLVTFTPSSGVQTAYQDSLDIADAANQYAPFSTPDTIAGLTRSSTEPGAVGVYGDGVTRVIAIPLRDREADELRTQLAKVPGVKVTPSATTAAVGPLSVRVTGRTGEFGWVVAGTVTGATLATAADDLITGSRFTGESR